MNNTSKKSSASAVTHLGVRASGFVAGLAWKGVKEAVKGSVSLIQGPKPYIEIVNTGKSAKDMLYYIVAWAVSHKIISADKVYKQYNAIELANLINTQIITKLSSPSIPLLHSRDDQTVYWQDILHSHRISFHFV